MDLLHQFPEQWQTWVVAVSWHTIDPTRTSAASSWLIGQSAEDLDSVGVEAVLTKPYLSVSAVAVTVWAIGSLILLAAVAWRYGKLVRGMRSADEIDEGPVRVAVEQIALDLQLRRVPELFSTKRVTSPFLFGVLRPRIVLPERSLQELSEVELRAVLTHELVHFKHHDTWIGWLQVFAQSIFWFHPFVWWANNQLRHERECVCDESVLRLGRITPQHYSESIVHVLTASRGRSLVAGSLVGVFERGDKLQDRLENIMNYELDARGFNWTSRLALVAIAILLLPMGPGQMATGLAETPLAKEVGGEPQTAYPQIVKTVPERGATDVDPGLKEITITFDRDMGKGMSWTGGPPHFPPVNEGQKARWTDARTCVLPVKLDKGKYYRVGVNSTSYQNFRSGDGVATPSSAIYFVTKGATAIVQGQARAPEIVSLEPTNGASEVDPKTDTIRVTFNVPMGEGMSWTGGGPSFPKTAEGKKASWSKDGRTCTLPVALEPGKDYKLGLNSLSHINFQTQYGVPLAPVMYTFHTRQ